MEICNIVNSFQALIMSAHAIQDIGEKWYGTATAYQTFKSDLEKIEGSLESWRTLVEKYGLSSDEDLMHTLHETQMLLEEEQGRLEKRNRRSVRWFFFQGQLMLNCITFPSQLSGNIGNLTKILAGWKEKEDQERAAEARVKDEARMKAWQEFPFKADERYVRLPKIEQDIERALNEQSVKAVLLVDRAGTGKSCMARHLALKYRDRKSWSPVSKVSVTSSSIPLSTASRAGGAHCSLFDEVLFVECGPAADLEQKQKELLKGLGWRESLEELTDVKGDPKRHLMGILRLLLRQRRVLIIFDDIWEDQFLEDMISVAGSGVKILVTAQRLGLCSQGGPAFARISMDRITEVDAQQILRAHAGFSQQDNISESIQECMTVLVKDNSTNPHILASMATTVDPGRRNELVEWETIILGQEELRHNLGERSTIKIQGTRYSTSMGLKFLRLNPGEMNLMILMSLLEGPSVPECVIQLLSSDSLFSDGNRNQRSRLSPLFSSFRQKLVDLQCVKVTNVDGQYFWAIHFLDSEYLLQTRIDDVKATIEKFSTLLKRRQGLEEKPQEHLLKLMAVLHFKSEWAVKVAKGLLLPVQEKVRVRSAIRDVVTLMMKNTLAGWSLSKRNAADQVFLSYMYHGMLHVKAVKILLGCSIFKQYFLDAVIKIVKVSNFVLSEDLMMDLLAVNKELRYVDVDQKALKLNNEQCQLLYSLAWREGDLQGHFVRQSLCRIQIVSGLVETFKSRSNTLELRLRAIETIGFIAYGSTPPYEEDRVVFLAEFPRLLSELAQILEDDRCPELQPYAAWVLDMFSKFGKEYGSVKLSIVETAGQHLVRSLGRTDNILLQRWAIWTLRELARGDYRTSSRILDFPYAMEYMVAIIRSENDDEEFIEVRQGSVCALVNILLGVFPSSEADTKMEVIRQKARICLLELLGRSRQILEGAGGAVEGAAVLSLTWIDPPTGKGLCLVSARAFRARGWSLVRLGCYGDALSDLNEADRLYGGKDSYTCRFLMQAKAKLGMWDAALKDGDRAMANASSGELAYTLQERGVLKHMMKNPKGALKDLEDASKRNPQDYEILKHRAYVKFLLGQEDEARKDAEEALPIRPARYNMPLIECSCLGTATVEFLNFRL